MRGLFSKAIEKVGEQDDDVYDWMLLNNGKGWQTLSKRSIRQHTTNKKVVDQNATRAKDQSQRPIQQEPLQQQQQQHQQYQQQYQPKKSGFWSKLSCGLCQ